MVAIQYTACTAALHCDVCGRSLSAHVIDRDRPELLCARIIKKNTPKFFFL